MSKDVLDKLDALLNKHREPPPQDPSAGTWMPVLTEVVKRGTPPSASPTPPPPAAAPVPEPIELPTPAASAPETAPTPEPPAPPPLPNPEEVAEQILALLEPRLNQLLIQQISASVRKSLDQTVSELIEQLDAHVRNAVQESVRERLANGQTGSTDA